MRAAPLRRVVRPAVDLVLAAGLSLAASAVYRGATGHVQSCDSAYSLVVAETLLADGSPDLSGCVPAGAELPYQLTRHPARPAGVYYGYPLGSTALSLPWAWDFARRGLSTVRPDGTRNAAIEDQLQLRVAARVSAAVAGLFYVLCRFWCPPWLSLVLAAGFAFGSPVWSTLSRALWSHTWMTFWLTVAVILLAGRRRIGSGGTGLRACGSYWRTDVLFGALIGTALFWVVFVRAHGVLSAAAVGAYLLLHHRRTLLVTVGVGGLWSAGLVVLSLHYFGTATTPSVYAADTIDGRDVFDRFAWLMLSPSRGLLVYCPYVAAVGVILLAFRRHVTDAGLLVPAGLAVAAHTALLSCYNGWHAGSSYGPRYFCDVLPWFVLATAVACRGLTNAVAAGGRWRPAVAAAALLACFGWGAWVHGRGANAARAWLWNERAGAVGHEAAVKEWGHPQFLCGVTFVVNPDGSVREK